MPDGTMRRPYTTIFAHGVVDRSSSCVLHTPSLPLRLARKLNKTSGTPASLYRRDEQIRVRVVADAVTHLAACGGARALFQLAGLSSLALQLAATSVL